MRLPFQRRSGLVAVTVTVEGPVTQRDCVLAVDTGAARTTVSPAVLEAAGFDLQMRRASAAFIGVTGPGVAPLVRRVRVAALGAISEIDIVALQLGPGVYVDGLLGLDFFRGAALTIDFADGFIELKR